MKLRLDTLLSPARTLCRVSGVSKKRIFETAADLICADRPDLAADDVYGRLLARERLGSTALGEGVALPHCRVETCQQALGALITLSQGIDFDAPEHGPVDILFLLLVPEQAQQEHLNILAGLAQRLDQEAFRSTLRGATSNLDLYHAAVGFEGESKGKGEGGVGDGVGSAADGAGD